MIDSDPGFVHRTLRSAAIVAAIVAAILASYAQFWAIAPLLAGALLGAVLLYGMDRFIRSTFSPERALEAKKKPRGNGGGRALLGFALVKYPLVALAVWAVVRLWGSDTRRIMAFAGGFILIQTVIGLRALGRFLVDRNTAAGRK